jgi:hypothetical protein
MRGATALLCLGALALNGCAASLAASAVGAAVQAGRKRPIVDPNQGEAALEACRARAAQYGEVHVIDVERRSATRVIVWGTAGIGAERQSFQCDYGSAITAFKLRPIKRRGSGSAN